LTGVAVLIQTPPLNPTFFYCNICADPHPSPFFPQGPPLYSVLGVPPSWVSNDLGTPVPVDECWPPLLFPFFFLKPFLSPRFSLPFYPSIRYRASTSTGNRRVLGCPFFSVICLGVLLSAPPNCFFSVLGLGVAVTSVLNPFFAPRALLCCFDAPPPSFLRIDEQGLFGDLSVCSRFVRRTLGANPPPRPPPLFFFCPFPIFPPFFLRIGVEKIHQSDRGYPPETAVLL